MFTAETNLRDLRQIARVNSPELSQAANDAITSRMRTLSEDIRHSGLTEYLGREHFDAFAHANEVNAYSRNVPSLLFNQLVDSEYYGFEHLRRTTTGDKSPKRLIFDLRPQHIVDIIIIAKRGKVGLGPYADELPSMSNFTGKRAVRNVLESAIEVGSFITLVEQGLQHKEAVSPEKPLNRAERFTVDLYAHLR